MPARPSRKPLNGPHIEITPTPEQYDQLCRDLKALRQSGAPTNTTAILDAVRAAAAEVKFSVRRPQNGRGERAHAPRSRNRKDEFLMQHEDSGMDGGAAILYAAKSTKDERGSNKTQLADGRSFAHLHGMTVVGEYADEDASAYHGNRGPELEAALDHAERIGACIIVQHSDRLARGDGVQARHLVQLVLDAKARGIRLRSKEDDSSLENVVMAAVMGERNTEDSRRKGAAVRAGMERKRQRGEYIGYCPYGYRWERNEDDVRVIVPDPTQAAIIRRVFAEYLAGRSKRRSVATSTATKSRDRGGQCTRHGSRDPR